MARLHALWTLDGLGEALDRPTVVSALKDSDGRVAAAAVRLAEKFIKRPDGDAELVGQVAALVGQRKEPEVRLQLALTLGEAKSEAGDRALRELVLEAGPTWRMRW